MHISTLLSPTLLLAFSPLVTASPIPHFISHPETAPVSSTTSSLHSTTPDHTSHISHHAGPVYNIKFDPFGRSIVQKTNIVSEVHDVTSDEFGRGIVGKGEEEGLIERGATPEPVLCHDTYKVLEYQEGKRVVRVSCE